MALPKEAYEFDKAHKWTELRPLNGFYDHKITIVLQRIGYPWMLFVHNQAVLEWIREHELMWKPINEWPDELKVLFRMTF